MGSRTLANDRSELSRPKSPLMHGNVRKTSEVSSTHTQSRMHTASTRH